MFRVRSNNTHYINALDELKAMDLHYTKNEVLPEGFR